MSTDSDRRSMAAAVIGVTVRPMESAGLRALAKGFVDRMYGGSSSVGIVVPADVIALLSVFQKNRTAFLSHEPRLLVNAKTYVLNKLLTRSPFHHIDLGVLVDMRRYILLLTEVLRSFQDEPDVITIEHVTRSIWYYEGINKMSHDLETAGRERSGNLEIEWWDAKITLKHCQYMLLSMGDSFRGPDYVLEKTKLVIRGVLQGYGNQFVDARATLNEILKGQRKREPWHEEYMELEAMYFENFGYAKEISDHQAHKEIHTVIALRNKLERELTSKTSRHSSTITKFQRALREVGRRVRASGPYEEHDYYFEYLLVDLLYKTSFRLTLDCRRRCFDEMIGGIRSALQLSHESAAPLHLKATDLYRRIDRLAKDDQVDYIKVDHRIFIERWIDKHPGKSEKETNSLLRSQWTADEILNIKTTEIEFTNQIRQIEAAGAEQCTALESLSTFNSEILRDVETGTLSNGNRPIIDTSIPDPRIPPPLTPSFGAIENSAGRLFSSIPNLGISTEYTTKNDRVIGNSGPTSELRDTTQHSYTTVVPTAGLTFINSASLDSRISNLEQQISAQLRLPSLISNSLSPEGVQRVRDGISSSQPQFSLNTDLITSQSPIGTVELDGLLTRIEFLEQLSAIAFPPLPSTPPISSPRGPNSTRSTLSFSSLLSRNRSISSSTCAPPDLIEVTSYDLFKPPISDSTIKDTIHFTALSANGQTMALSTQKMFRIFQSQVSGRDIPVHLVCTGHFANEGRDFQYSQKGARMETQVPLPTERFKIAPFSCLTASNEYLAVGCIGRMMVFTIEGKYAGRWVCDAVYGEKTFVEKLEFSADGRTLVALLRSGRDQTAKSKALIYSTENIQKDDLDRQTPVQPMLESPALEWKSGLDAPTSIAFSGDGRTIAISTTHDAGGTAKIRLLKRVGSEWRHLGFQPVPVLVVNDMFGDGLTGIRFFRNDQYLALSIDSRYRDTRDCYRILASEDSQTFKLVAADKIVGGEREHLALAIWQEPGVVILLNKEGGLQMCGNFGSGPESFPLVRKKTQRLNNLNSVSMVFDNGSQKLFFLDHRAHFEIHEFKPSFLFGEA